MLWQKLVSFRNKWYKIEKFSDVDLGYLIVERVPNSKFNAELEELKKYEQNNYADSIDQGLSEYENVRRNKSLDSTISNNRYSDRNISSMAQSGNSGRKNTINGRQNSRQSNGNKQGNNRYSLKDGNIDYNYSKGQISKYVAEHSKLKAYTRTDAEQTINTIVANQLSFGEKYGDLSNKTEQKYLWN